MAVGLPGAVMRRIDPHALWIGHVGHVRDLRAVLAAGITALVDLAANEPSATITRDLVYCRFPLVDGGGNAPQLLRLAIRTTANLLAARMPTLVYCSVGLSRSPCVVAAALSVVEQRNPDECLTGLLQSGRWDVSPLLWRDIKDVLLA
jgi:protein-tyrosine phosphatase